MQANQNTDESSTQLLQFTSQYFTVIVTRVHYTSTHLGVCMSLLGQFMGTQWQRFYKAVLIIFLSADIYISNKDPSSVYGFNFESER